MINEEIKKLLDSDIEDDNNLGWELVKAKKISYEDVVEYVEKSKVPTNWVQRYTWDGNKFVKNPYFKLNTTSSWHSSGTGSVLSVNTGGTGVTYTGLGQGTYTAGTNISSYWNNSAIKHHFRSTYPVLREDMPNYKENWKREYKAKYNAEIQKEKELDKPRGIWASIKNAFK